MAGEASKFHATEFRTPQLLRRRSDSVKVELGHLSIHVGDCVLLAHRRKRDLHNQRFGRGPKIEDGFQAATFYALCILGVFPGGLKPRYTGDFPRGYKEHARTPAAEKRIAK